MKKILIIGAGLTGCVLANLFKNNGDSVDILEKESEIGGLCKDYYDKNAKCYVNKNGPHIWHDKKGKATAFLKKFSDLNKYKHKVLCASDKSITYWPASDKSLKLYKLLNDDNLFIENFIISYSEKQWKGDYEEVLGNIKNRFEFKRINNNNFFDKEVQGIPTKGYTNLFKNMVKGCKISYNNSTNIKNVNLNNYDYVFCSAPIDVFFNNIFGKLAYITLDFKLLTIKSNDNILPTAVVNLPNHKNITRVTEYNLFYYNNNKNRIIGIETPRKANDKDLKIYFIPIKKNIELHKKYLKYSASKFKNLYFVGRFGQGKYLNMDVAVYESLNLFNKLKKEKKI